MARKRGRKRTLRTPGKRRHGVVRVKPGLRNQDRPSHRARPKPAPKLKKGGPGDRRDVRPRAEKNTTFVIYRTGNSPPSSPDVSATDGALIGRFASGAEASEGDQSFRWTHVLEVSDAVDVRDDWPTDPPVNQDVVYVPDENGTSFDVIFVELVHRGEPQQFKRVYLNRQAASWPTDEL